MSINPYASPETNLLVESSSSPETVLANRSTRLAASLIDSAILILLTLVISSLCRMVAQGLYGRVANAQPILVPLINVGVMLVIYGYPLVCFGQTIGKFLFKIQILDAHTNKLLPFERVCVFRYFWKLPLSLILGIGFGRVGSLIVFAIVLIDVLLIFGSQRRCLHDYFANSKVVLYQDGRQREVSKPTKLELMLRKLD